MLVKHLSGNEGEVIVLFALCLFLALIYAQLIVELLLIIEEEEFVLENVRTTHLHLVLILDVFLNAIQSFTFFFDFLFLLYLFAVHFLSHLREMGFQNVLIGKSLAKCDLLSEFENVNWLLNRLRSN